MRELEKTYSGGGGELTQKKYKEGGGTVGVRKLRNGKAQGNNAIVTELLKNGGQALVDWLWELLKQVWRE